jgi:hypothetical protein
MEMIKMLTLVHLNWHGTPLRGVVEASKSYEDARIWHDEAWFGGDHVDVYEIHDYDIIEEITGSVQVNLEECINMTWYRVRIINAIKVDEWRCDY